MSIEAVVDRVLAEHSELRAELLDSGSLAQAHGDVPLREALDELDCELQEHLLKEERVLLPWIRAGRGVTAGAPIRAMLREHDHTLAGVARLRALTNGYRAPSDAVAPLYRRLESLERLLIAHIALENDVLFPMALGR
jgi:regulator of cell morphogenesis and NO signaling